MRINIRTKLIVTYIFIILIMSGISLGFIGLFSEKYIISDINTKLEKEAKDIARILGESINSYGKMIVIQELFITKISDFNYSMVFLDAEGTFILGYNIDGLSVKNTELASSIKPKLLQAGTQIIRVGENDLAMFIQPIKNLQTGVISGYVIPFFPTQAYSLSQPLLALYIAALLLAALFSVLIGTVLAGKLTRNITKLKKRASLLANRQFDVSVPINSSDEIGDLAENIDLMANSIKEYDLGQKIFLQNASHELRTPLMSIRGYIEGMHDGIFDTEKASDEILLQVARLEKLVEEVLYLSKIETTEGIFEMDEIDISCVISETIERTRGIVSPSGIKLKIDEISGIKLLGDCDKLATVLTNIISNCIRFARSEIEFKFEKEEENIAITISDDGNGISPEDIPHIFNRFYKGKKGKHGLGLAIAKAIVLSHKGTIKAYNKATFTDPVSGRERCGGAVFEVKLPIMK